MSRAAALIQRAAYLLWLGLIPLAAFLSFSLSVLAAGRQHAVIEAEVELLGQLPDLPAVGVTTWDTTARDTQSLMTVLDEMDIRLAALQENSTRLYIPNTNRHTQLVATVDKSKVPGSAVKDALRIKVPADPEALETSEDDAQSDSEPITVGVPDRLTRLVESMEAADVQDAKRKAFKVHNVTKYRFLAHAGACPTCIADDGKVYPTQIRRAHHNGCKCTLEAFTTTKLEKDDAA